MTQDQLLTLQQVGERLQVSMSTVRRMTDRGDIPIVKVGRNVRVRPEDLQAYVDSNVEKAK